MCLSHSRENMKRLLGNHCLSGICYQILLQNSSSFLCLSHGPHCIFSMFAIIYFSLGIHKTSAANSELCPVKYLCSAWEHLKLWEPIFCLIYWFVFFFPLSTVTPSSLFTLLGLPHRPLPSLSLTSLYWVHIRQDDLIAGYDMMSRWPPYTLADQKQAQLQFDENHQDAAQKPHHNLALALSQSGSSLTRMPEAWN